MFKKTLLATLLLTAGIASAADLATVNGEAIPQSASDEIVKAAVAKGAKDTPELRAQVKNSLILNEVLWQAAEDQKLDSSDAVEKAIANVRRNLAIQELKAKFIKDNAVSDADATAAYNKYAAAMKGKQYWTKHIIVKTEPEAKAIISQLMKGAKFETIASQKNIDNTKANGGDLGWQLASSLVKPYADAIQTMKVGETSYSPVKTPDGNWHIIRLVNIRNASPEPYAKVKDTIKANLLNQKWNAYVNGLVKNAKIEQGGNSSSSSSSQSIFHGKSTDEGSINE